LGFSPCSANEGVKYFVYKGLLESSFARKLLSWKHSGFSVDNSMKIPATSKNARINLSQYIIRHPVSLQKILYVRSKGTVIYKTKYNEYWKENVKLFKAVDFIAELTTHIPPKHKHLGNPLDCTLLWAVLQQNKGAGQKSW
jgi:phage pi2 protein 07